MPRKNLTARFVETVKVETRVDYWDDVVRGLVLRVSPSSVKTWCVVYTRESDGTKRRVTLGKFPAVGLDKARGKALATMTAVVDGKDPSEEKRTRREAMTVEDLGAIYIEKYAKRNKRSWKEDERHLKVDIYPFIGRMKAVGVRRRDILDIIEAKADAGHMAASAHVLAVVRKMFNWAVDGDYLESSPAAGVRPRGKAVRRDRVLSDDEMREIWDALPSAGISAATADVFRLLFLTGQRSGEVTGIRRSEIDLEAALWTIPGLRVKNGLVHVVPLSSPALAIVKARLGRMDDEQNAPLFSKIGEPIESNAIAHAARLKLQITGTPWTPHDIRRTVATGMAGIGIAPHIIEACLNHISGFRSGVAGVYNRNRYEGEKRQALVMWANHLDSVLTKKPSVVVPISAFSRASHA